MSITINMNVAAGTVTANPLTVPRLASTRIYVPRTQRAKIDSGLIFGTGGTSYGYELLANNPNGAIRFQSNSSGVYHINVRLEASDVGADPGTLPFGVNFAGLFIRNPAEIVGSGAGGFTVSSDNASGYSSLLTDRATLDFGDNDPDQGIFIATFAPTTDQFWQITVDEALAMTELSMLWVGTYFDIHAAPAYGYQVGDSFAVVQTDLGFGRVFSQLGISGSRWETIRTYVGLTAAQYAELRGAWLAAYGTHVPVILCDEFDPDQGTLLPRYGRIVRFTQFNAVRTETPDERWNVQVGFRELAIIPFGRSY